MKPDWHWRWRTLVAAVDAASISATLLAITVARFGLSAVPHSFIPRPGRLFAQSPILFGIPVWLAAFAVVGLYSPQRCQNPLEEGRRLVIGALGSTVGLVMVGFIVKENPARSWLFGSLVIGTLTCAVGRKTIRAIIGKLHMSGRWLTRTVIVGRRQAKALIEALDSDTSSGVLTVATCGIQWSDVPTFDIDAIKSAVVSTAASQVIVVAEELERYEVALAVEAADELPINVVVLPGLDNLMLGSLQLGTVANEPGLVLQPPAARTYQATMKRIFDLVLSGILLLLTAPVMLAAAIAVRLDSPGPIMFRQPRQGRGDSTFETLKLRTMIDGAPPSMNEDTGDLAFLPKYEDDPRVTKVGRWLRRSSIDELPQLWNVLRGDMSLVGPRPLPLWEAKRLGIGRRVVVRPGITGLWQVSGRSALSPEERIRLDLVYVQNWSLLLDLSILLRTVPAVLIRRGAY